MSGRSSAVPTAGAMLSHLVAPRAGNWFQMFQSQLLPAVRQSMEATLAHMQAETRVEMEHLRKLIALIKMPVPRAEVVQTPVVVQPTSASLPGWVEGQTSLVMQPDICMEVDPQSPSSEPTSSETSAESGALATQPALSKDLRCRASKLSQRSHHFSRSLHVRRRQRTQE